MRRAIIVPEFGVGAAMLSVWFVRPGERVFAGDRVVELLLGAATFDIAAPCSGRLVEKMARPNDRVNVGQILGYIEEDAD